MLGSSNLMPFSVSAIFLFHLFHMGKTFSLWGLFSSGETKKGCLGWDWLNGECGAWGHAICGEKLLNTQCIVGRCIRKSPITKWANALKESSKNFHLSWTQLLTTMPAGPVIQMGSRHTHLVGEACTTSGPPSRRLIPVFFFFISSLVLWRFSTLLAASECAKHQWWWLALLL